MKRLIRHIWNKIYDFFLSGRSLKQVIRYLITGFGSFIFEYTLFVIFLRWLGWNELIANSLAVLIAFVFNFVINRLWSFKSKEPWIKQLLQYLSLFAFNLLFSNGFIYGSTFLLGISPLISKVLAMCLIVSWNFIIYKKVIFKST